MTTKKTSAILLQPLTERAAGLLEARGLDLELAERYGVQSVVPRRPRDPDDEWEWIAFPHLRSEAVVHHEYRVIGPKPLSEYPGSRPCFQSTEGNRCFWNENVLFDSTLYGQDLIITEGRLDALACIQAGFPATISVCDGAPDPKTRVEEPKKKYSYVVERVDEIKRFRSVILATDADNAGALLLQDIARIIGRARCRWVDYRGAKDANKLLLESGESALTEALHAAKPLRIPGLYTYHDLPPSPEHPAVACGIDGLDDLWRFRVGETSVLVGMPGSGKTTMLNCVSHSLASSHGWVTAWFTPEQPTSAHKRRLIHRKLERYHADAQERARAAEWVSSYNTWLYPEESDEPDDATTVEWFCSMVEAASIRHNVKLVVCDPWNELEHDWPVGVSETDYVGRMLKKINKTARLAGVHIVVCVHPTKLVRKAKGGYDAPDGYSCHGGANWYNKAYQGLSIHRVGDNLAEFTNWKAKFQDENNYSRTGSVLLRYNAQANRFEKAPPEAKPNLLDTSGEDD